MSHTPQCSPSATEGHAANCVTPLSEVIKNLTPDFLQRAGEVLVDKFRALVEGLSSDHEVELSGEEREQDYSVACCGMPSRETAKK